MNTFNNVISSSLLHPWLILDSLYTIEYIVRAKGDKTAGKAKAQDPIFEKFVEQVRIFVSMFS